MAALAVRAQPGYQGCLEFAVGFELGTVKIMRLVLDPRAQYENPRALGEARAAAIEKHHFRAAPAPGAVPTVAAPTNLVGADAVPFEEGGVYDIVVDGASLVPTSDKLFFKTKWTTPSGTMRAQPVIKLPAWDTAKLGNLTTCMVMVL